MNHPGNFLIKFAFLKAYESFNQNGAHLPNLIALAIQKFLIHNPLYQFVNQPSVHYNQLFSWFDKWLEDDMMEVSKGTFWWTRGAVFKRTLVTTTTNLTKNCPCGIVRIDCTYHK